MFGFWLIGDVEMTEQKKVITRGNIGKCIWDTASEEAKKKILDTYNEMVKHGFVITVMPTQPPHQNKKPQ